MLVKKAIPSSTQYESRGKSMADILKEKAGKFLYAPKPDRHLMELIKKNQDPTLMMMMMMTILVFLMT